MGRGQKKWKFIKRLQMRRNRLYIYFFLELQCNNKIGFICTLELYGYMNCVPFYNRNNIKTIQNLSRCACYK